MARGCRDSPEEVTVKNAEIAELLNKAAHALMGGIPLTDKSKEQLVKDLLFAALSLPQDRPKDVVPVKPASGVTTRGMTADIPPPRTKKTCCKGDDWHEPNCPMRGIDGAGRPPKSSNRDARFGDKPLAVCHWDTFDSDDDDGGIMLVGGADTLEEAIQFVKEHYGARLKADGADRVDIVDLAGKVVWKHNVG